MNYLQVLQKIQRVYISCKTRKQFEYSRRYANLLVGNSLNMHYLDRYDAEELYRHNNFLREYYEVKMVTEQHDRNCDLFYAKNNSGAV